MIHRASAHRAASIRGRWRTTSSSQLVEAGASPATAAAACWQRATGAGAAGVAHKPKERTSGMAWRHGMHGGAIQHAGASRRRCSAKISTGGGRHPQLGPEHKIQDDGSSWKQGPPSDRGDHTVSSTTVESRTEAGLGTNAPEEDQMFETAKKGRKCCQEDIHHKQRDDEPNERTKEETSAPWPNFTRSARESRRGHPAAHIAGLWTLQRTGSLPPPHIQHPQGQPWLMGGGDYSPRA